LIWVLLDGDISADDAAALSEHLEGCEACRREQARAQSGDALIRRMFDGENQPDGPVDGFWERLSERLEEAPARRPLGRPSVISGRSRPAFGWRIWVPTSVGVLVLGLWGTHWLTSGDRDKETTIAREKHELEQIHASLQDMEAELDGLLRNWN
jgi:anti-sigma factor RsiW